MVHSIFVMEKVHRVRIEGTLRESLGSTPIRVLDIPDDYQFMNPELVHLLQERVGWHLDRLHH